MGIQFKPSETIKSDDDKYQSEKSDGEKNDSENLKDHNSSGEIPDTKPDLKFNNTEYVHLETIALPPSAPKKECKGALRGFCQHFAGMIPGLLALFACSMQLCWGTIQYDLAIWKQMNGMPYCTNILTVVCWYIGAIIGSPIGGCLVLNLGKKYIYMLTALLLLLSGESLRYADSNFHHITGRTLLGVTFSIAQLSTMAYASEVPIKKLHSFLLFIVGYINAVSVLFATMVASIIPEITGYGTHQHTNISMTDRQTEISDGEDEINYIISMTGTIIMIIGIMVLILAPLIARESVPFLVYKRNFDQAFLEYEKSYVTHENSLAIRNDFEHWKLYILSSPRATMNIFKKANFNVLRDICCSRLLSMLFSSIYMSAIFVRMTNLNTKYYDYAAGNATANETVVIGDYDQSYDLNLLLGCKSFQLSLGLILLIVSFKCNIERFCYKMAAACGFGVIILYVIFCIWAELVRIPYALMLFFTAIFFVDIIICLMLRVNIDMFHYMRIGHLFDDDNNCFKVWSLVFVNCVEHIAHILLLIQIFWFVSYPLLFSGFGILFISFWFLKQMQIEQVQPWENGSRAVKQQSTTPM